MTKEEKRAIEDSRCLIYELSNHTDKDFIGRLYYKNKPIEENLEILLNLIEKLQKENEEVKDILTPEEKEYLGNIIKPFKCRVTSIRKAHSMIRDKYYEAIEIYAKSLVLHYKYEVIVLPVFKTPMYKNMEINKEYTLEELGL